MALFDFMGKTNAKVELLAPAGNYESFLGAIHAGADAVYLGGEKFGARAYADNFSEEEICRAISYAHVFDKKVYLTVNTLIKDNELQDLVPYLTPFYMAGLDGVIVQDMGALLKIREVFPGLELHASTQMTLTGAYGVDFLKQLGVVRIVSARELSLQEMIAIKEKTGLEVEAFVHGAMCYCYSGQCLFSSILGGRSGNRGRCAQPCRLPYRTMQDQSNEAKRTEGFQNNSSSKEEYPLSLNDMCTINLLPDLIEAGIDSFKIEGRMKKPEYAAGVTAIYRKYIDLYYEKGKSAYKVDRADMDKLSSLYIRSQIQEGYYFKHNGADMVTLQSPAYNGSDEKLLHFIRENYINSPIKQKIRIKAEFLLNKKAELTLYCRNSEVTVQGQLVETAAKQPVSAENIISGLIKLGNTPFSATAHDIELTMDEGIFYPLKAINELRREAINKLIESFCQYERTVPEEISVLQERISDNAEGSRTKESKVQNSSARDYRVLVTTEAQLNAFFKSGVRAEVLYLETGLINKPHLLQFCREKLNDGKADTKLMFALPFIVRKKDYRKLESMLGDIEAADGVLVRNLESLNWLRHKNYKKEIVTDTGLYCFNKPSLLFWQDEADCCCLPYELNKKELNRLLDGSCEERTEQVAFGRIPLMITANCVAKTAGNCLLSGKNRNQGTSGIFYLEDRYRKEFPVMTVCEFCYNIIFNTVPLSLHEKLQNSRYAGAWRLSFTTENEAETIEILRYFSDIKKGKNATLPLKEYTLGHEKRGVE